MFVSGVQHSDSDTYVCVCICILFQISFFYRLLQNIVPCAIQ